ncbi:MurR/RpiR family transcriptional regulator [Pseudomonadota bacterium AL_CKDN230030165-1A_HGKHYDSX7]
MPDLPLPEEVLRTLRARLASLPPELERAAHWVVTHPVEVGLWSMRRQAQAVGVAPATMLRLARAAGHESYDDFRRPFQSALAAPRPAGLRERAAALQASTHDSNAVGSERAGHAALRGTQVEALTSAGILNTPADFDAAARTLLAAPRVGFLGMRSAFGIAFQMRYAYQLIRRNGMLIDGLGDTPSEQIDTLERGDALVVLSQAPYPTLTVTLTRQAIERGVDVIALTDSPLSPVAASARHVLRFAPHDREQAQARPAIAGPGSFFHTTAGLLALAEHLVARVTACGGEAILERLTDVEARRQAEQVYWHTARQSG